MQPKAKAKAKAKTMRVLAIHKYAQVLRDMQAAACLLDDRDLVKRAQKPWANDMPATTESTTCLRAVSKRRPWRRRSKT